MVSITKHIARMKVQALGVDREPIAVNIHDFPGDSLGRAAPYGIYDVLNNHGTVCVGTSADTPAFAVDVIARWWKDHGQAAFPTRDAAADSG